jgi:glycosyltransferase involved in cell wall biosynthesis
MQRRLGKSQPAACGTNAELFTSFDAMLVPLKHLPISRGAIPCKMLEAMAAAVLISLSGEGEGENRVQRAQCGIVMAPGNPKLLADAVRDLYHNDSFRRRLSQNGRQYALDHHDRQRINQNN